MTDGGPMEASALKLLLIEDSRADADLIRTMLAQVNEPQFAIEHVERLEPGLERLRRGGIDLVLLDFHLPDSSGMETFEAVWRTSPGMPTIILTNLRDEETAAHAVREGAQDYLVKREVDERLLARSIRYALERSRSEQALRRSEERYALAVRGANDGLWDWDLQSRQAFFSPRWKAMLGFAEDEIDSSVREWFRRIHPDDAAAFKAALEMHLAGRSEHFEHEHRMRTRDGSYRWMMSRGLVVRDDHGEPCRMAGSMSDIAARKAAEEQLLYDAMHDALTGLPNRALFTDRLGLALARARRQQSLFAVLFLDLDRFKTVNDSLGHAVGDQLLVRIAERLSLNLRPGDSVARLGGDEFALLLNDVKNLSDATLVAERVQELLSEKYVIDGHEVFTTVSIGIALSSSGYTRPDEMLRDADLTMYRAKAAGRARSEVFDRDMHKRAVALLKLETDLRRAVEREEFVMHYQPIVSLTAGRMVGFEALVRWQHPERGLVRPQSFIGVAEETGLIVPLGWWVLGEACRQTREWQERFPMSPQLSMSVNVSGRLFMQSDVIDRMVELLESTRLDPASLRLEITENVLLDHGDSVLQRLAELRALGVQLHIDDFGTGYSSLSYLQRFRYDSLKIDRSFISQMSDTESTSAIVQTIVTLANELHMNVIAEGVETAAQLDQLRAIRCPQGQGYWFAEPLDGPAAEALLANPPAW